MRSAGSATLVQIKKRVAPTVHRKRPSKSTKVEQSRAKRLKSVKNFGEKVLKLQIASDKRGDIETLLSRGLWGHDLLSHCARSSTPIREVKQSNAPARKGMIAAMVVLMRYIKILAIQKATLERYGVL